MSRSRADRRQFRWRRWELPYGNYPTTPPTSDVQYEQGHMYADLLVSGGNHGRAVRRGLNRYDPDRGGNFHVEKYDYQEQLLPGGELHFTSDTNPNKTGAPHYIGQQYPYRHTWNSGHYPASKASSDAKLIAYGTTGIARTLPTKPKADLGTFLGEAREGLPKAILISSTGRARTQRALNGGDEYLNVEFGWAPLVRDVRSFAKAVVNSEKYLQQYREGSGKLIKRRYEWPTEFTIQEGSQGIQYPQPLLAGALYGPNSRPLRKTLTTVKVERWFTASYIYYTPLATDSVANSHVAKAQYLLGARLTPSTLWNLAPWSWAADWVSNTGDVMDNLSAIFVDGLVIHHAYVMERSVHEIKYWMECSNTWKTYPGDHVISQTFTRTTKKRLRATPYGFGLSWDGFTPRQLGILAALGVSKTL